MIFLCRLSVIVSDYGVGRGQTVLQKRHTSKLSAIRIDILDAGGTA